MKEYSKVFDCYDQILFYSVDPGCFYLFNEIRKKCSVRYKFFCDGWAKDFSAIPHFHAKHLKMELSRLKDNALLVIGSQTNFEKTFKLILFAKRNNIATAFIFDHWKNYTQHFNNDMYALPDYVFVPNELSKHQFLEAWRERVRKFSFIQDKIRIGRHLILEKQVKDVRKSRKLANNQITLFLDPESENDQCYPGYSPHTLLKELPKFVRQFYPDKTFIIKPHPRQDIGQMEKDLLEYWSGISYLVELNAKPTTLIANSIEAWGVTTICLIMAKLSGVSIKSFQLNRNATGYNMSNQYIEPNVILTI